MNVLTAKLMHRRNAALLMAALSCVAILSISTVDSAHACRPDMDLWSPHCGAP